MLLHNVDSQLFEYIYPSKSTAMKYFIILFFCVLSLMTVSAQNAQKETPKPDKTKKLITAEVSCGQCQFGLAGKTCDLAIRMNGKAYFVDGTTIDSHGDAHASDGFCNAVRKAEVQGELVNDRFKSTYMKLLPETPKPKKEK